MIGIIGAMEEEVRLLESALQSPQETRVGPLSFWVGKLDGKEVVLARSGIGKVNAAAACTILLERFAPKAVINTGSAGGIGPDLTFGDLVVSDSLVQYDVDVTAFGYAPGQVPNLPAEFKAEPSWVHAAEKAFAGLKEEGLVSNGLHQIRGQLGSGDVFVHDPQFIAALRVRFPKILAVEMEGAAIAQVCHLFSTPFVALRSLSDVAGKESPMKFEEFLPLASKNSSLLVRRLLKENVHG